MSPDNTDRLTRCVEGAADEIDFELDRGGEPLPDPAPALIVETNVARAVEWWKAADAAYGIVGYEDIGAIRAPKDGFARHAANLTPYKIQFGMA